MGDIFEGGFFDRAYADKELPEDFFDEAVYERIKDDPTLIKFYDSMYFEPDGTCSYGDFDFVRQEFNVGPRDVTQPIYYIDADYGPAETVYDWYLKCQSKGYSTFPDLPVAKIGVAENKYEKRVKKFPLEQKLTRQGFHLFQPSYSTMVDMSGQSRSFAREVKWSGQEEYKTDLGLMLFEQYNDTLWKDYEGDYISMQFNPHHPFAISKIVEIETDGTKSVGVYKDGSHLRKFEYDLADKRYRMCSDQWMPQFDCIQHYAIFDLVSNFDFRDYVVDRVVKIILEPLIIEPLITNRVPSEGYSVIGPWEGELERGVGEGDIYTPYATYPLQLDARFGTKFYEVTNYVKFVEGNMIAIDLNSIRISHVKKVRDKGFFLPPKMVTLVNGIVDDPYVYMKHNKRKSEFFRVFFQYNKLRKLVGKTLDYAYVQRFMKMESMKVASFPVNRNGAIVYDFRCITLYEALAMNEKNDQFHEFITLSTPIFPRKIESKIFKVEDNLTVSDNTFDFEYAFID